MARPRIAFVGSGGATKGVAHIGAVKALEELGLRPDIFVGASAGAIAGAFLSQGVTADEMIDWMRPTWARQDPRSALKGRYFLGLPSAEQLRSPGWLTSGLLSIDRFERFLAKRLPVNDFRKLDRPLMITAADVDGRGRVVFGQGYRERVPVSQAIAASCCVPLLFRPYKIDGRYYIDGEVVRTLSIDLAVEAGADVIIVSNVYRPHVTRPGEPSIVHSGVGKVVNQTLNVMLSEKEKRGIDLIHRNFPHVTILNVSADLGHLPFLPRKNARQLLTRGYREALKVLSTAKQRGLFDIASNVRTVGQA
ncbi:MAG: patatin-like phospholipase family protein [Sandaracinaceae bacterium]